MHALFISRTRDELLTYYFFYHLAKNNNYSATKMDTGAHRQSLRSGIWCQGRMQSRWIPQATSNLEESSW